MNESKYFKYRWLKTECKIGYSSDLKIQGEHNVFTRLEKCIARKVVYLSICDILEMVIEVIEFYFYEHKLL